MLHLAKGEIVGFAHEEGVEMNYIETTNILEMEGIEQRAPRNWIPERRWKNYRNHSEISLQHTEVSEVTAGQTKTGEISPNPVEFPEDTGARTTASEISQQKPNKTEHLDESDRERVQNRLFDIPRRCVP